MILRSGLGKVRRTASEGVTALRKELNLYSAAVGVPGLVIAQYLVDKYTPLRFENELEKALRESLADVRIGTRRIEVKRFTAGAKPPQLLAARVYDLGPDALGFDFDTEWESELVASLEAVSDGAEDASTPTLGLTGGGGDAWAQNRAMDAAIVAAMRSAERMTIRATDKRGRRFANSYSLSGAATAMDAATLACARR